jgi:phospholipid/cholesterol/gamma-HCH transport system substrate-binding protein
MPIAAKQNEPPKKGSKSFNAKAGGLTSTVKVGLLALLSLLATIGIILWLQGRNLSQGKTYTVQFADVDGLAEGAAVQLMGIRLGFIQHVTPQVLQDGKYAVNVTFNIARDDVSIPKGSHLSIQQSGLVGEKFLEITPPQLTQAVITIPKPNRPIPNGGFPVSLTHDGQSVDVGKVYRISQSNHQPYQTIRLWYRIHAPGVILPNKYHYDLDLSMATPRLLIDVADGQLLSRINPNAMFSIENPMRLKRFLEVQLESAEALKATNDKINQLMSDDTIMTLRSTLRNTEKLTAEATRVVTQAESLFKKTSEDLDKLVVSGENLSQQITHVAVEMNKVIGNPAVQQDITQTIAALKTSSQSLQSILNDPQLKQTLSMAHSASTDAAASLKLLHTTLDDIQLQQRLDTTLTQLNTTLTQLEGLSTNLNTLTVDQKDNIQSIVTDTKVSAESLRKFTKKLGGRFTLFKLMF